LCHVQCWMGSLSLNDTLHMFYEFRRLNPREIVTIFIEIGYDEHTTVNNSTKSILRKLLTEAFQVSGLVPFLFEHPFLTVRWPSLSDMIAQDKQIVVFVNEIGFCDKRAAPWLHCKRQFLTATPHGITVPEHLGESCVFEHFRSEKDELTLMNLFTNVGSMGVNLASLEWFVQLYSTTELEQFNRNPFLHDTVQSCSKCSGRYINFVAVDFWASSDVLQVVADVNANRMPHHSYPQHADAAFCGSGVQQQNRAV